MDVDESNGCIELIPGYSRHKRLVLRQYSTVRPYREAVPAMAEPIKVPVPRGSVLLFDAFIPHTGTPNTTNTVRWTLDLRYHRTEAPSGRSHWPSFQLRAGSSGEPPEETAARTTYEDWCRRWKEGLDGKLGVLHRHEDPETTPRRVS